MSELKRGVVFPQTEFPLDPAAIRDFARTVEGLGFDYILAYDHVLGANPERPGGWRGPYTYRHPFHEPFVLYSHWAAVTERIGFATAILILPQRQTALVAKQAAALDFLSGGRLRLGVGIGWNPVEYAALNQDFARRGQRIAFQVDLLRMLWTRPLVTAHAGGEQIDDAGLNPLPVQRPIPIWMGGTADPVLRRMARLADGWFPQGGPAARSAPLVEKLRRYLEERGRDPESFGIDARLSTGMDEATFRAEVTAWRELGATHLALNTLGQGLASAAEHLSALERYRDFL